jgi:hypothetical protein
MSFIVISDHVSTYLCSNNFTLDDLSESPYVLTCLWETHPRKHICYLSCPICTCENSSIHHIISEVIYTTWILTVIHVFSPLWEHLLSWEETCKHSTVNFKVIDTRNITWISAYVWIPVINKYILFVWKDTQKLNCWQKCEEDTYVFTTYVGNRQK